MITVGERIRDARKRRSLSLADVASKLDISAATLSRIETDKQPLQLDTFLRLARIVGEDPSFLLAGNRKSDGQGSLLQQIARLSRGEKQKLWQQLARKSEHARRRNGGDSRQLAEEVDELLAQVELIRSALLALRRKMR
ncbi:MAG: helix-turn-helix transcriptional regulator [Thermoanaerobaculia bacterium]